MALLSLLSLCYVLNACSSGPSICECGDIISNPLSATKELSEKCAKKFKDYSPRELMEKYQKECE